MKINLLPALFVISFFFSGGLAGADNPTIAALDWLKRHQSPDGSWKAADYVRECKKTCRNLDPARYGDGRGAPEHDVGVTGLAMLAIASHENTHLDGPDKEHVKCLEKAVSYLKKVQVRSDDPETNGRFGGANERWIYDHAIATMAMSELLVMSNDVSGLKDSVTDAVKLCLLAQNDGSAWRYGVKPGDNDTSVTGWMVLALKMAKNARLEIPRESFWKAFQGAQSWLQRVTASNGRVGYRAPGDRGSMLDAHLKKGPASFPFSKDLSAMTAVGVLARIFSGEKRSSESVRNGAKVLMEHTPKWDEEKASSLSTINFYYWYYGTYALFQFGGSEWKKWNEDVTNALVRSQRSSPPDGGDPEKRTLIDEDGSWDPIDEWGLVGGRVYSTALAAMTLGVYERSLRAQRLAPIEDTEKKKEKK